MRSQRRIGRWAIIGTLGTHLLIASLVWGPGWLRQWRAADSTVRRDIDMQSTVAPLAPQAERMGRGILTMATGESGPLELTIVPWSAVQPPVPSTPPAPAPRPVIKPTPPAPKRVAAKTDEDAKPPVDPSQAQPTAQGMTGGVVAGADGGSPVPTSLQGAPSFASSANLFSYVPSQHILTVLLRLDEIRGTPWEPMLDDVLRPLPDYQILLGGSAPPIATVFESLVISTRSPSRSDATMLAGRTRMPRRELMKLLSKGGTIDWRVSPAGAVGVRAGEARVFVSPNPNMIVLVQPRDLGNWLDNSAPPSASLAPGPVAAGETTVAASSVETVELSAPPPPWLGRWMAMDTELTRASERPALVVTGRIRQTPRMKARLEAAAVTLPEQVTLSLTIRPTGFVMQGNLVFADEAAASSFLVSAQVRLSVVMGDPMRSAALELFGAKNLLRSLTWEQSERVVSYATSMSSVDATKFLRYSAAQLREHFAP